MDFLPSTEVIVRGLRWEVVETQPLGDQTRLRLRGVNGVYLGKELDVLFPFEEVKQVTREFDPNKASPLQNWLVYHEAFLLEQALGPDAFLIVQPGRLRIEPYQLVPLVRALQMSRPRLLLADDVGLGKTVEAGLVIAELMARRLVHRLLIVTPAGPLLDQWQKEMLERFGLRLEEADRNKIELIRRGTELGSNPFHHLPLAIASMDFLKQDNVLDLLERTTYDLVVIDEAHHYNETGADTVNSERLEASQRRKLAQVLARRSDALLLLTATPHDGYERSFASLVELLDPSLVDMKGRVSDTVHLTHVVRRLKRHVKVTHPETGDLVDFPQRKIVPVQVVPDAKQDQSLLDLQIALLEFIKPALKRALRTRQYDDALAYLALLKRSTSTRSALANTLTAVGKRFQSLATEASEEVENRRQRRRSLKAFRRRLARFGALTADEEAERESQEVEELAQQLKFLDNEMRSEKRALERTESAATALARLQKMAQEARDIKLDALVLAVQEIRSQEPQANVLIYTEYVDSLQAAKARLEAERLETILTLMGNDDVQKRDKVTNLFRSQDGVILISTDASAEGLNLHQRCHHLIHLELPWNPNRLEQRNGRIDRYGQWQVPIVRYLYVCGTFEERILARLIAKYERQRDRLRFMPNTLGMDLSELPEEGLFATLTEDSQSIGSPCGTIRFSDEENQEQDVNHKDLSTLLQEVDKSLRRFEHVATTHRWLGEEGAAADATAQRKAAGALEVGRNAGDIDLLHFVKQAVQFENGKVQERGNIITFQLPKSWQYELEGIPGWNAERGILKVTTDLNRLVDEDEEPIGFLGRAHPVVRRAIEHVRHQALGQSAGLDQRISAAFTQQKEPSLLVTFLGRVDSRSEREYERILSAKISKNLDLTVLEEPKDWLPPVTDVAPTKGLWEREFADWSQPAIRAAQTAAQIALGQQVENFKGAYLRQREDERLALDKWFAAGVEQLVKGSEVEALPLFEGMAEIKPPMERLENWMKSQDRRSTAMNQAEALLEIYQRRISTLSDRSDLTDRPIQMIGILMLIPKAG